MNVTDRIRAIRAVSHLTQMDVAAQLGVSYSTYKKMEKGTAPITVKQLERLAEIFDVPMFTLFGKSTGADIEISLTGDERLVLTDHLIRTVPVLEPAKPVDAVYKETILKILDKIR